MHVVEKSYCMCLHSLKPSEPEGVLYSMHCTEVKNTTKKLVWVYNSSCKLACEFTEFRSSGRILCEVRNEASGQTVRSGVISCGNEE